MIISMQGFKYYCVVKQLHASAVGLGVVVCTALRQCPLPLGIPFFMIFRPIFRPAADDLQ